MRIVPSACRFGVALLLMSPIALAAQQMLPASDDSQAPVEPKAIHSFDLSAYAGQTVTLEFTGTEDNQDQTSFVIDDTALTVG